MSQYLVAWAFMPFGYEGDANQVLAYFHSQTDCTSDDSAT
jgi:hypothetical protein